MGDSFTGQKTQPTVSKYWRNTQSTQITQKYNKQTQDTKQESPADADKPARRESMPKIATIRCENKLQTS